MPKKTQVKLTKEDKFRQCPKCYGPIDYFNTCRQCGRPWTPTLTKAELLEMEAEARGEESEDPEPVLVGERESLLDREKEEIIGEKAKPVGAKKHTSPMFKHWEILDGDDDTEITRKRSLMRLDARKVYNQMGLAMRAYQTQKKVLICLSNLWGFLDGPERDAFAPTAELLKQGLIGLAELSSKKVNLAAEMEEVLVREKRKARTVRSAKDVINAAIKKASKLPSPGADTEGFETVDLVDLDPEELMEQVKLQLAQRTKKFQKDAEEQEN